MMYDGMTVNERLYTSGLIDEFDRAVEQQDANEIRKILKIVELSEESITPILKKYNLE